MLTSESTPSYGTRVYHADLDLILYRVDGTWYTPAGYSVDEDAKRRVGEVEQHRRATEGSKRKLRRNREFATVLAFALGVLGVIIYSWAVLDIGKAGTLSSLGDFIAGTVGPLWALAGVLLVYVAFLGQQQQALAQEQQILDTQRDARRQQFESAFFQLLNLHNEIVHGLRVEVERSRREWTARLGLEVIDEVEIFEGRDVFTGLYQELVSLYAKDQQERLPSEFSIDIQGDFASEAEKERVLAVYEPLHRHYQSELGHYFRNLYTVVKYVDESEVEDPKRYTNIIRAQLSSDELLMLFYNCLSRWGKGPFYKFVIEYQLLHNVPIEQLLRPQHEGFYPRSAFGQRVE